MFILLLAFFRHSSCTEINYSKNKVHLNTINEKFYVDFANRLSHLEIFTEYMEIVIGLKAKMRQFLEQCNNS